MNLELKIPRTHRNAQAQPKAAGAAKKRRRGKGKAKAQSPKEQAVRDENMWIRCSKVTLGVGWLDDLFRCSTE